MASGLLLSVAVLGIALGQANAGGPDAISVLQSAPLQASEGPAFLPCDSWELKGKGKWVCKPAVLFVGGQRCSTSGLVQAMKQHPNFDGGSPKHLNYWKSKCIPGTYKEREVVERGSFADETSRYFWFFRKVQVSQHGQLANMITADFSSSYWECVTCPGTFRKIMPHAKLVVILREPLGRSFARYREERRDRAPAVMQTPGFKSFRKKRLREMYDCIHGTGGDAHRGRKPFTWCASHDNVFGWSLHSAFLSNYLRAGYTKDNLLILYVDRWAANPEREMKKVEKFLGLPAFNDYKSNIHLKYDPEEQYKWGTQPKYGKGRKLKEMYIEDVKRFTDIVKDFGFEEPPRSWLQTLEAQD